MDPFTIASLLAMIGGTAMQYKASNDAADRARKESLAALQRQDQYSREAEQKALDNAKQYTTDNRQEQQNQIQQKIEQDLTAPVESANQISAQATTTQGDVSNDYLKAKAQSEVNLKNNMAALARTMSKVTSAHRQRENEAVRMADTGNEIARIGNFANGTGRIDQLAVQQAARPDSGLTLVGSLLQGAGMMGLAGGFGGMGGGEGAAAVDAQSVITPTPYGNALSSSPTGWQSRFFPPGPINP